MCAIHALNNLFQDRLFTAEDLDFHAQQINEHNNLTLFNFDNQDTNGGQYEFNTINAALETRGITTIRLITNTIDDLPVGLYLLGNHNHWIGWRRFTDRGPIWCFDSLADRPIQVRDVRGFLASNNWTVFYLEPIENHIQVDLREEIFRNDDQVQQNRIDLSQPHSSRPRYLKEKNLLFVWIFNQYYYIKNTTSSAFNSLNIITTISSSTKPA